MIPHSGKIPELVATDATNRRQAGRFLAERVKTSAGEILDVSATGMRLFSKFLCPSQKQVHEITVKGPDGDFKVVGRVAWVRKVGIFAREYGFEFYGLDPFAKECIADLARNSTNISHMDMKAAA